MSYVLIEPCCGSAALTLHAMGSRKSLMPYQGSKWKFRKELFQTLQDRGAVGPPAQVILTDAGPWGRAISCVLEYKTRLDVIAHLKEFSRVDPEIVYTALHGWPIASSWTLFTAQFLFLQRLAFSGKAVGITGKSWCSPGFNTSSAYGLPATDRFGKVSPMIPSLIKTLESLSVQLRPSTHVWSQMCAPYRPRSMNGESTFVYIDPPYQNSTEYPNGRLPRLAVVDLALGWADAEATVMVSEAEPILELLEQGWKAKQIYGGRKDTSPFRGKQEEWVTISPKVD